MRADPVTFQVFTWAQEGKLPNIAKLMARGTWGHSVPTFPSHTPTNFATLLTGSSPAVHGIADGPMRVEGRPLARPSVGGFSSSAKKAAPAWSILEQTGRSVYLLSVPGSTPPELGAGGTTVRGRWGGWGADFANLIFESESAARRKELGRTAKLFMHGAALTRFVVPQPAQSPGVAYTADLDVHGLSVRAVFGDADGDGAPESVAFGTGEADLGRAAVGGEGTGWSPVSLAWKGADVETHLRFFVIEAGAEGHFRLRAQVDQLNRFVAQPPEAAERLREAAGPMVDFVDNFPAQLIHAEGDREAFLLEARQSLAWHRAAAAHVVGTEKPDVFIHDIYTPNQMLTSRWWMGAIDPDSVHHAGTPEAERAARWAEVLEMYQGLDAIVGEALVGADEDTVVVLSSDHGAAPMNRQVRLNNLFADKGWLATSVDPETGAPIVDWDRSQVVFLNMYSVFIDPEGLGGDWTRASGEAYEALRREVSDALFALHDADGTAPVASVTAWEFADTLHLPTDRVGDLLVSNHPGFGWSEETTADGAAFVTPKATGYKQAIAPGSTQAVWTPFIIAGPGIKQGVELSAPVAARDQLPTILKAMGVPIPDDVEGQPIAEAFTAAD